MGEDQGRITPSWRGLQDGKQLRRGIQLAPQSEASGNSMVLPESLSERAEIGISRSRG
jgi:hypothetical protein